MTVLKYLFAVLVTLPILFLGVFLMKRYSIELRKTNQNVERKAEGYSGRISYGGHELEICTEKTLPGSKEIENRNGGMK